MGIIAAMWTLALRDGDIKQKAQLVADFSKIRVLARRTFDSNSKPRHDVAFAVHGAREQSSIPGCDQKVTVAGTELW